MRHKQWRPIQVRTKSKPVLSWRPKYPIDRGPNSDLQLTSPGDPFTTSREVQEPDASTSSPSSPPLLPRSHCKPHPSDGILRETPPTGEPLQLPSQELTQEAMANFACDPAPFLPFGAHVVQGWHRPARARLAIGGEPPRRHE